jgi:hypothetical protein
VEIVTVARAILLSLLVFCAVLVGSGEPQFSTDSAYASLRTLVADIGPRPMGSPAEQRTLQFAADKFKEFGCQEAYVMPMTVAAQVNTSSGIAVGVLKGSTGRIILIGGHCDSAGPDIPGANDDGSGAACVIELARVLSQRKHESTIVFCCWGGEEEGLRGSTYFVDHFDRIDSVALMIQLDMADGASYLEIDPDYNGIKAPQWLTQAAYTSFYSDLGYRGMIYPTASATINSALGGATGSDHDAFLQKGIPAIDFTSDVDYPIHTPQDNLENFSPAGLKKSGDLALRLVERFDAGVPSRETAKYMIVQFGIKPFFIQHRVLWIMVGIALVLAILALIVLRDRSKRTEHGHRIRWSSIKLIVFVLIIQTCIWMSETLFGFVTGYRFPWVNGFGYFALLGLLSGIVGLWFALKCERIFPISKDPFGFGRRSLIGLTVLTLFASLTGPELALFPALSLLFMALALLIKSTVPRVLFWLASLGVFVRLIFFEEFGLILRSISENTVHTALSLIGYEAAFIVGFTLISMPFVYGFVAIYRDGSTDLFWINRFRTQRGLTLVFIPPVLLSGVLYFVRPSYDQKWYSILRIEQRASAGADSSVVKITSSEYFNDFVLSLGGKTIELNGRENFAEISPDKPSGVAWSVCETRIDSSARSVDRDSLWIVTRTLLVHSVRRPLRVEVRYTSDKTLAMNSPWAYKRGGRFESESDTVGVFTWYAFPDTLLKVPVTFSLVKNQKVCEMVDVTFDTLACPVQASRPMTNIRLRTIVTARHEFGVPPSPVAQMPETP